MNFKMIAAAVALVAAAGSANAAIDSFSGVNGGNGSLTLLKLDSTGATTQGLIADLGLNYSDFANGGLYGAANTTVVWDFSANTMTVNGALKTGVTNDWAGQFATFAANSDAAETKWAIISGSQYGNTPYGFLSTGTPNASQLNQQNASVTANWVQTNQPLIHGNANFGTLASADNGAYSMPSTDKYYVGASTVFGTTSFNGWRGNSKWSVWQAGTQNNLWQVNANGTEARIGDSAGYTLGANDTLDTTGLLNASGTFTLQGNTLTWKTATITPGVPEPTTYGLALAGVLTLLVARRRAAK